MTPTPTRTDCLDEATILATFEGTLSEDDLARIEEHLDVCERCREFVAAVARTTDAAPAPATSRFAPGESCDRYLILNQIGAGGMGVVYAAWDHKLDRKVALKVVAPGGDARAQARLVREAKAMAAVRHPNVITVYEVGQVQAGVYIAMEYVDGPTLRRWIAEQQPSWRAIVSTFIGAGRGLAAAHAAGVVHRDFKPDNVLIDRTRPCVADFGLARDAPLSSSGDALVTRETTPAGTPAYMAPEQRDALSTGPAADQYAFAAALWEGLFGVLPSSERPASARAISGRVRRVLERALAKDPRDRFPSVSAMLHALERATRRRPWPVLGAGLVVGVGAIAGFAARPDACANVDVGWRDAWSPEARARLRAGFEATDAPHAPASFDRLEAQFDRYVEAWVDAAADVCAHPERPRAVLRQRCLDTHQTRAIALLDTMEDVSVDQIELAIASVFRLPRAQECDNPREVLDTEELTLATSELDELEVLLGMQSPEFPTQLAEVGTRIERLGHAGLSARVAYLDGMRLRWQGELETGAQRLRDAARLALEAGQPHVLFNAAFELSMAEAQLQRFEWAEHWLDVMDAVAGQLGERNQLRSSAWSQRGFVHRIRGEFGLARDALRRAVEHDEREGFGDATMRMYHREQLAAVLSELGEHDEAVGMLTSNLDEIRELYGEASPHYGKSLGTLATAQTNAGEIDASLATWDESVRILSETRGKDDVRTMVSRAERAVLWLVVAPERARPELEAALEAFGGARSGRPITFLIRDAIARSYARTGQHDEAVRRWTTLLSEMGSSEETEIGLAIHFELGKEFVRADAPTKAREHFERVRELADAHSDMTAPFSTFVDVALASLTRDEAVVRKALESYAETGYVGVELAYAKFVMAQIVHARGGETMAVASLLDEATEVASKYDRVLQRRIEAWRQANAGTPASSP